MIPSIYKLAWRETKSFHWRLTAIVLILATLATMTVTSITDRLLASTARTQVELYGGDWWAQSDTPFPQELNNLIDEYQLTNSKIVEFYTAAMINDEITLVEIKAVDNNYPLYGELRGYDDINNPNQTSIISRPRPGEAFAEPRVLAVLDGSINDEISIGFSTLNVKHILSYEPDHANQLFSVAPRVLIHQDDLEAINVLTDGSRAKYRVYIKDIDANTRLILDKWANQNDINSGNIEQGPESNRFQRILQQIPPYFHLTAIIGLLLAGVGMGICAGHYALKNRTTVSLLRALGMPQKMIMQWFLLTWGGMILLSLSIGLLAGYAAQNILVSQINIGLNNYLPELSWSPFMISAISGCVILLGFSLPLLWPLLKSSPMAILTQHHSYEKKSFPALVLSATFGMFLLQSLLTFNLLMSLKITFAFIFAGLILYIIAHLVIHSIHKLSRFMPISWRFGLSSLKRHLEPNVIQLMVCVIAIGGLISLTIISFELTRAWQSQVDPNAPNVFVLNVTDNQIEQFSDKLESLDIKTPHFYQVARSRLETINNNPIEISEHMTHGERRSRLRTYNLGAGLELPDDNRIISGTPIVNEPVKDNLKDNLYEISIENQTAEQLGVNLGDTLEFQSAGFELNGIVTNIRTIEWSSFHVNFFIMFPPAAFENLPKQYIASFHIDNTQGAPINELMRDFPNITFIDIDQLLQSATLLATQTLYAIKFLLIMIIVIAIGVVMISLWTTVRQRQKEHALLNTFGAKRRQLVVSILLESSILGICAGFLASGLAQVMAYTLSTQWFQLEGAWYPSLFLFSSAGAAAVFICLYLFLSPKWLNTPPMKVLIQDNSS